MRKASVELAVGIFVLIGLACVGYLTIKLGKMELMGDNYYEIHAKFRSAAGLKAGSNVEIAGVRVGQVKDISLDPVMHVARVTLKIDKSVELSDDVVASVKTSGLIGDKYIAIGPGGSGEILEPGSYIEETESALDIEDLVSKYIFGEKKKEE